jgi:hypothetical protein
VQRDKKLGKWRSVRPQSNQRAIRMARWRMDVGRSPTRKAIAFSAERRWSRLGEEGETILSAGGGGLGRRRSRLCSDCLTSFAGAAARQTNGGRRPPAREMREERAVQGSWLANSIPSSHPNRSLDLYWGGGADTDPMAAFMCDSFAASAGPQGRWFATSAINCVLCRPTRGRTLLLWVWSEKRALKGRTSCL